MIRLDNLLGSPTDPKAPKLDQAQAQKPQEAAQRARTQAAEADVQVKSATRSRFDVADLRLSVAQQGALASADVASRGLGTQRSTLEQMRVLAVDATSAQFTGVFASGKELSTAFEKQKQSLDQVAKQTNLGGRGLADGTQAAIEAPVGDGRTMSVALQATTAKALGVEVSLGSQDDAKAAVKALDAAIGKVDKSQGDVFKFREGVSQVAEGARKDRFNSNLLRTRDEALAMADQVSKSLPQDAGNGASYASQMLAKSVPSAQSVLSLLRSE